MCARCVLLVILRARFGSLRCKSIYCTSVIFLYHLFVIILLMKKKGVDGKVCSFHNPDEILPSVEEKMRRLMYLKRLLDDLQEVELVGDDIFQDVINPVKFQKEFHKRALEFYSTIDGLEEQGMIVQDLDIGEIDVPVKKDGKNSYLTWVFGDGRESSGECDE